MEKQTIKLNESQLRNIIKESIEETIQLFGHSPEEYLQTAQDFENEHPEFAQNRYSHERQIFELSKHEAAMLLNMAGIDGFDEKPDKGFIPLMMRLKEFVRK